MKIRALESLNRPQKLNHSILNLLDFCLARYVSRVTRSCLGSPVPGARGSGQLELPEDWAVSGWGWGWGEDELGS